MNLFEYMEELRAAHADFEDEVSIARKRHTERLRTAHTAFLGGPATDDTPEESSRRASIAEEDWKTLRNRRGM